MRKEEVANSFQAYLLDRLAKTTAKNYFTDFKNRITEHLIRLGVIIKESAFELETIQQCDEAMVALKNDREFAAITKAEHRRPWASLPKYRKFLVERLGVNIDLTRCTDADIDNISISTGVTKKYLREQRKGQMQLRSRNLQIYNFKCCVTGCADVERLDAAHIVGYADADVEMKMRLVNSLCLRTDIHRAFDRCLMWIDKEYRVRIHKGVRKDSDLWQYEGQKISLPEQRYQPSRECLAIHEAKVLKA